MLEVRNLTKRYNGIPAVENISFSIRRGQILGYLGPKWIGQKHHPKDGDRPDRTYCWPGFIRWKASRAWREPRFP